LGGEVRDDYPIVFLGCQNKDEEVIVFASRFGINGVFFFTSSNYSDYFNYSSSLQCYKTLGYDADTFYDFIKSNINKPSLVDINLGPITLTESEYKQMLPLAEENEYIWVNSGNSAAVTIVRDINVAEGTLGAFSEWQPANTDIYDEEELFLEAADVQGNNINLFEDIPTVDLPLIQTASMHNIDG
jgi:hypothetical protein